MACTEQRARHSYRKGEPKGSRVCLACGQKEESAVSGFGANTGLTVAPAEDFIDKAVRNAPPFDCPDPGQEPLYGASPAVGALPALRAWDALPEADRVYAAARHAEERLGLPAHSRLGASSAERWMKCSASVAVIAALEASGEIVEAEDPEWTRDGKEAHELALHCLSDNVPQAWFLLGDGRWPHADIAMAAAVQTYIDYVRKIGGRQRYEVKLHAEELHPQMFGTVDCEATHVTDLAPIKLEITDYKNGAGVFVSAVENVQMMYYACLVIAEDESFFLGSDRVRLTIAQPNAHAAGGPVRSWDTTVHDLKQWLVNELLPAMRRTTAGAVFDLGKHCQFCPAKVGCPAMQNLAAKVAKLADQAFETPSSPGFGALSDEVLGRRYEETQPIRYYLKAIEEEVKRRLLDRREIPGAKLVETIVHRVWKEDAEGEAVKKFGDLAYSPRSTRSPAQLEAVPGGKTFVAEWAYKPQAGMKVAYATDLAPAVVPKLASDLLSSSR